MARKDVARQLWMAQTAIGSLRRRRRREEMRLRGKVAYDTSGKTDEQILEELFGPNWREVVLGEGAGVDAPAESDEGSDEGDEEPVEAEEPAARTPIATDDDGLWQPGTVSGDKTPIATPESWAGTDDTWQYGR